MICLKLNEEIVPEKYYYEICKKLYFAEFAHNEKDEKYYKGKKEVFDELFLNKFEFELLKQEAIKEAKKDFDFYFGV